MERHFTLVIDILATSKANAELLRDEIVGAIEDNTESGEIDAEAMVGQLTEEDPPANDNPRERGEDDGVEYADPRDHRNEVE